MDDYTSNRSLEQIADALTKSQSIAVTTHAKPDGDAIGSVLALTRALELMGKEVHRWFMPPIVSSLNSIIDGTPVTLVTSDTLDQLPEPDRIVVVDTGAWSQVEPIQPWLESRRDKTIIVDHHLRGDDLAAMRYIDSDAAAAAEIVAQLIDALKVPFDQAIANALYVGIASDTGWFRFSNARPFTHQLAARLLEHGVNHAELYADLEQADRPEKLLLTIRALDSLQLVAGQHAAIMSLRTNDFEETGATMAETERLVDLPQVVKDVQVVVLVTEDQELPRVRLSFRSKPGPNAVNVSELAQQFGGGGHARAAGAKVQTTFDELMPQLIEAVEEACASATP